LNEKPEVLKSEVGHGGPDGYHSQELIEVLLKRGFAVTAIERHPVAQNPLTLDTRPIEFQEGNDERFSRHLLNGVGVLMGKTPFNSKPHAVSWTGLHVRDSKTKICYEILSEEGMIYDLHFSPQIFLRVDKL
jgi:hypothetical protein